MDFVVRKAEQKDLDGPNGLAALRKSIATELSGERGGLLFLADRGARTAESLLVPSPDTLCEIAEFEGAVLGWSFIGVRLLTDGQSVATIEELAVDPEAREVGAGEALLESALAWCREKGCTGADSFALPGARETKNFFETFGLKARLLTVHIDL